MTDTFQSEKSDASDGLIACGMTLLHVLNQLNASM